MIDLFAGAGGMTAGFVRAGYEPVYAVDLDPDAAATYRENFGAHIDAVPIEDVPDVRFPAADVVVGGPPCQGFSSLGRMNGKGANTALNDLWSEYTRVVESVRPAIFVVENVPQFLRSAEFDALRRRSETLHYEIAAGVLNSAEFGVPQKRRRAFVIGSRVGSPTLPEPLGGPEHTVHDAVGHLRPPEGQGSVLKPGVVSRERDLHFRRTPTELSLRRYALIPPGGNRLDLAEKAPELTPPCWLNAKRGNSTDVFGRLRWDEPALTIRTEFFKPEKGRYLHPEQDRSITHLEAALLQTFDEGYRWTGSKISIARQIGNAVPPRLAEAVALHVTDLLRRRAPRPSI